MCGAHKRPLAMERAVKMHQAAIVNRRTNLSAGVEHAAHLVGQHSGRDICVLDGEGAAEATALLNILDGL